jgi:signal transduction histidine kinase
LAPRNYEFRFIDKYGQIKNIFLTIAMIPGTRKSVASLLDITELKYLEERVRHATKIEAIGRFASNIAHDFKNFLTVITGYSELLIKNLPKKSNLLKYAEQIQKTGEEAISLIQKLLTFSRNQALEPNILCLNDLIKDIQNMIQTIIGEDIVLELNLDPDLKNVKVDRDQMEQVVMNLVVNARDAMPKGGKLTIETSNVNLEEKFAKQIIGVKPGPYIMLKIKDTGIGMDTETLSHIFEPYFSTKEKGTGLGLSTAYGFIRQSGGSILAQSEKGKGSTFIIYLPIV